METKMHEMLKKLRKKGGFTQDMISAVCGVGISTYKAYENGTSIPNVKVLMSLSVFFGVSTDTIIFGDESSESLKKELDDMVKDGAAEVPVIDIVTEISGVLKKHGVWAVRSQNNGELTGSAVEICEAAIRISAADGLSRYF